LDQFAHLGLAAQKQKKDLNLKSEFCTRPRCVGVFSTEKSPIVPQLFYSVILIAKPANSAPPRETRSAETSARETREKTRKKLKRKFERGLECDASNARPTEVCQAILFFFPFALFRVFRGPFFFSSFRGLCGGAKRGRFAIGILEHDDEYEDDSSISDCLTHSRPSL
jgi:hypothetical protein